MPVATHIIKLKGTFDEKIWDEKKIEDYVDYKIENEINETFNTDLELFNITGNNIEIWVFIFAFPSEVNNTIIDKWIRNHIKEEGLKVDSFEFEKLVDIMKTTIVQPVNQLKLITVHRLSKMVCCLAVLLTLLTPAMAAEATAKSVAIAENGSTATAISGAEAYGYNSVAKADAEAYAQFSSIC